MQDAGQLRGRLALKEIVAEASRALARLDAARLEELAVSCQALTRALPAAGAEQRRRLAGQARDAQADMAVFSRILEATRANLSVMQRLRELRMGRIEYTERQARGGGAGSSSTTSGRWPEAVEGSHGEH